MSTINTRLLKLYHTRLTSLISSLQSHEIAIKEIALSSPLLICPDENYLNAKIKVLFIGQKINKWGTFNIRLLKNKRGILAMMKKYQKYYRSSKSPKTHFWKVLEDFMRAFNQQSGNISSLWTNVDKINEYKVLRSIRKREILNTFSDILVLEIKILKPQIVIFLTGPHYDKKISAIFNGVRFIGIKNISKRKLAKLSHNDLPANTFRLFHPNYLVRFLNDYKNFIKRIVNESTDYTLPL